MTIRRMMWQTCRRQGAGPPFFQGDDVARVAPRWRARHLGSCAVRPGVGSARGAALVEMFRASLEALEALDPAEQDAIVTALVADLRARQPASVAPFGEFGPPTEPIADPRVPR